MEREESSVGISDLIASFLQESLEETDGGVLEVQRNDLAQRFNCVPSQINYVMSTRFSPERGYIVESRRGGNGYIRITRVRVDRQTLLMQVINTLGSQVDLASARAILNNLVQAGALEENAGRAFWPPSATRPWPRSAGGGTASGGHHEASADPAGVARTQAAGKMFQ
ncbi:MAG: CtsR family transcriptional regulator [Neglectibacter sp.]